MAVTGASEYKERDMVRAWRFASLLAACAMAATATASSAAARSVALVIGNSAYPDAPIRAPKHDALEMAERLKAIGYDVRMVADANKAVFDAAIAEFARRARGSDKAVIYYSGHGQAYRGRNYLIPVGVAIEKPGDARFFAKPIGHLISAVARAKSLGVVVIDACRPPYAGEAGRACLALLETSRPNVAVVFSTLIPAPPAKDDRAILSPFTAALSEALASQPDRDVRLLLTSLTGRTSQLADRAQIPWVSFGPFGSDLAALGGAVASATKTPAPVAAESSDTAKAPAAATAGKDGARFRDRLASGGRGPEMVVVPGGVFALSDPSDDRKRERLRVTRFAIGRTEVTVAEYRRFVRATGYKASDRCAGFKEGDWEGSDRRSWRSPGFAQDDRHPVVCVSWRDAKAYADWLSKETGADYRLPTDAQWEYAARAQGRGRYIWGNSLRDGCRYGNGGDRVALRFNPEWSVFPCSDGRHQTAPVASYRGNLFGLYDMMGNVWEWTLDCRRRVDCTQSAARGGSWRSTPHGLRIAARHFLRRSARETDVGFRVARVMKAR
ncbi:MAG: SUMF1/EgtB/PvdO family nonheme iron enzyme [Neomegalonema sp.]|nr:SUMF1/EgtB/PvdO family nonheme iron enzyme [Neomegalonema sp.]